MTTGLNVVNRDIDKINILWLCKYILKVSKHSKKVETVRMRLLEYYVLFHILLLKRSKMLSGIHIPIYHHNMY